MSMVHGSSSNDPESLDASIYNYAVEALLRQHTGKLLNVSLPSNFSGIKASVFRTRSGSLWQRGANFSSVYIPSGVIPFPFVKRLAIVYQNLGNRSSHYYKVPGYSLVAPVVGFMAYDASNLSLLGREMLQLSIMGDSIVVKFSKIVRKDGNPEDLKCVKIGEGGTVQFRNVTEGNTCLAQSDGHFSLVVPSLSESKVKKTWEWWVIGFGILLFGIILVVVILTTACKMLRSKRIAEMEGESEKGVAFDMKWIGKSKMPSASMVRTQPALEHGDIP
ncbi:conserved hypothetical protein [Ricinus communis]|uniref:Uncharacterized protein n=2 Tax=Ricinus communis TaxID=3988 RepID=B9RE14_RICCO|nr:conserved hypothetical protein [Ricinus communis]